MLDRRELLAGAAASAFWIGRAHAENAQGVTDKEIKIGQTMPYSGPASAYGVIGKTEAAYFRMINEQGGVNGRTINFISLDDSYSPPKTVEQVRRLVEQEQVAFLFNTLGTAPNLAIRDYCNQNKVPQLYVSTGASAFSDPEHYRWTMGYNPNYRTEARIYAKHILTTKPDAKIGVLYQNDGFGKDYLAGLKDVLGADHAGMIVKEASYETSEPTIDSQIVTLQGSGADVLVLAATPKFAAQAIRKSADLGFEGRALSQQRVALDRHGVEAGGPGEIERSDHRLLRQGPHRSPLERRRRHEKLVRVLRQIYEPCDDHRRQRVIWLCRGQPDDLCAEEMRRRSLARKHSGASGQRQGSAPAVDAAGPGFQTPRRPITARSGRCNWRRSAGRAGNCSAN